MLIPVLSDIHIWEYKDYDLGAGFRKNQFKELARRAVREGQRLGTKTLFIAGDTSEKPVVPPRIQHLIWNFFDELATWYDDIRIIFGQHDMDSKILKADNYEDSIISLLEDYPQVHYMNGKILELDGRKIYFRDFQFKKEITCDFEDYGYDQIDQVDIWISHVTLGGFGQLILNPEAFKLGVFGDIHTPVEQKYVTESGVTKCYSVVTPFQHDMKCSHEGFIGVINTVDLTFQRISIIDAMFNPLVIAYDDEYIDPKHTTVVRIPRPIKVEASGVEANDAVELFNLDKHLDEAVPEQYKDLLNEVRAKLVNTVFDRVNLNFKVRYLSAKNYWSIDDIEFNFDEGKSLVNFIGRNGSGKTTVTRILQSVFEPKASLKYKADKFKDNPEVEVKGIIEYQGSIYTIVRNSKTGTKFWINDEEQTKNTQPQLEKYINECLPFVPMLEFFILHNGDEFYKRDVRVKLMYQAFNLDQLQLYAEEAYKILKECNRLYNEKSVNIKEVSAVRDNLQQKADELTATVNELRKQVIVANIEDAYGRYQQLLKTQADLTSKIEATDKFIKSVKVSEITQDEYNSAIQRRDYLNNWFEGFRKAKTEYDTKVSNINSDKYKLNQALSAGICPTCKRPLADCSEAHQNELRAQIAELDRKLSELASPSADPQMQVDLNNANSVISEYEAYNKVKQALEDALNDIQKYKSDLDATYQDKLWVNKDLVEAQWKLFCDIKSNSAQIDQYNSEIVEKSASIDTMMSELKQLESDRTRASEFMSILEKNNPEGVAGKLLAKLCNLISNDQIKFSYANNDVMVLMKVQNQWVEYDRTSGGQRVVTDLLIMQRFFKLLGRIGFMSFDEYLAPCDYVAFDECAKIIEDLDYNLAFYISQADTFNIHCRRVQCELINNYSQYTETM